MRVLWSTSRDVHANLAAEEAMLDRFAVDGPALFFYVNTPAIVVGKNQNPWREAATGWARREGVPFARRVSGGGTVWHDEGNLNFSLLVSRKEYDQTSVFNQTRAALKDLGVETFLRDGNSLVVEGRKISGTAFCFRGAAVLHHGTVLIRSDLDRLRRAMASALPDVETRAIASRPASVLNVAERVQELTPERVARALARRLAKVEEWTEWTWVDEEGRTVRHREWAWVFGHSPAFSWAPEPNGPRFVVERGWVVRVDAPDGAPVAWTPTPFERETLAHALGSLSAAWAASVLARDW